MGKRFYRYFLVLIFSFIFCFTNVNAKKINEVNIGDYIKMTPTSTSYTIDTTKTGYDKEQVINPSELNLWRVIRKNTDGTVDVVSEYVLTTKVYFQGLTGYLNLVGSLNTIASQYTNSKYVVATRHMGYSNQIEKCEEASLELCVKDTEYETDVNLVKEATRTLIGKSLEGQDESYFLASRDRINESTSIKYSLRFIDEIGSIGSNVLYLSNDTENADSASIRPILTLKADIDLPNPTENEGKVLYDLDSINEDEKPITPEEPDKDNGNQNEDIKQEDSKGGIENPNTGEFTLCVLIFAIIILVLVILNINKKRKIFKL